MTAPKVGSDVGFWYAKFKDGKTKYVSSFTLWPRSDCFSTDTTVGDPTQCTASSITTVNENLDGACVRLQLKGKAEPSGAAPVAPCDITVPAKGSDRSARIIKVNAKIVGFKIVVAAARGYLQFAGITDINAATSSSEDVLPDSGVWFTTMWPVTVVRLRDLVEQGGATAEAYFPPQADEAGSGSSSQHTSGPLTVYAATASSEIGGYLTEKLIDSSDTSLAHTSDGLPVANSPNGVGQMCPWWQLDLGATKTVDKVKLTAEKWVSRMRRLLFVEPMHNNAVSWGGTDMTGGRPGGVRVLVGNLARNRADTSELLADGRWSGNAVGSICPEPATGEECETIQCDDPTTCLDRFAQESTNPAGIGTAEVDCNGKQGRYVIIELPGLTADDSDHIRAAGLTEVRVEGTSPPETTTLTVDAATASSEIWIHNLAEKLIDGDFTSMAHVSDSLPVAADPMGVGQRCPWWQLDLGASKTVDKVKLTAQKNMRMRPLLFVEPMNSNNK
eukprot:g3920.t1